MLAARPQTVRPPNPRQQEGHAGGFGTRAEEFQRAGLTGQCPATALPVPPALRGLLPGRGLRRGATVSVTGSTSLLLALLAQASADGAWCAVVGMPALGPLAAAEFGVALERLALVPDPGRHWAAVVAALLDGFDMVVVSASTTHRSRDVRRLTARARERRAVLLSAGAWEGAQLRLTLTDSRWEGLGDGHGHLRGRQVTVRADGRGAAARGQRTRLWLPAPRGGVEALDGPTSTSPLTPRRAQTDQPDQVALPPRLAQDSQAAAPEAV